MERIYTNKSIWKKIVIAILVIMAFQYIVPLTMVFADTDESYGEEEGDNLGFGGVLLKPFMSLLVTVGDGVMNIMHSAIMGMEMSLLHIDLKEGNLGWAILKAIIAVLIVAVVAVAAIMTAGASTALAYAVLAVIGGSLIGVNVIDAAAAGVNGVSTVIASTIVGDDTPNDLYLPMYTYTPEEIFKGHILLFNVNFFENSEDKLHVCYDSDAKIEVERNVTATGEVGTPNQKEPAKEGEKCTLREYEDMLRGAGDDAGRYHIQYYYYLDSNGKEIKTSSQDSGAMLTSTISRWYVAIRNICIVAMLSVLVYIGIRMLLSTIAGDKAKYKEMLKDWIVGLCLLFVMHYIMAFSVTIVQKITDMVATTVDGVIYAKFLVSNDGNDDNDLPKDKADKFQEKIEEAGLQDVVNDENGNKIWWTNLMGFLRLSIQFDKANGKYIGETVCFLALVAFTVWFTFTYLKRLLYMAFLTIIAPFVALTYCIDKVNDGSAQGFNTWLKEYIFNLLIQPLHLLLYYILVTSAIDLAGKNVIYSLVAIGFMIPAEKLLRNIFGFSKAQTPPVLGGALGTTLMMQGFNKLTGNVANGSHNSGGGAGGSSSSSSKDDSSTRFAGNVPDLGTVLGGDEPAENGDFNVNNSNSDNNANPQIEGDNSEEPDNSDRTRVQPNIEPPSTRDLNNENGINGQEIDTADDEEDDENQSDKDKISDWASNARNWYDRGLGNKNRRSRTAIGFNAKAKLGKAKGFPKNIKRAATDKYRQFDKDMNHMAPKHWRRAKIAGRAMANLGKSSAKKIGGMAVGAMAAAPLAGLALAGGIASGDPSKAATAVGAAMAAGRSVGKRVENGKLSNLISPEVKDAINSVNNSSMYKGEREERRIKELKKDKNVQRMLEELDKETGRELIDNGHFDEYIKNGYSADREGLQQMIASEKLINDKSPETARITTVAQAAAVKETAEMMGKSPSKMKAKDRNEWRKTFKENYSAYGEQKADAMTNQTMSLATKFYKNMPV